MSSPSLPASAADSDLGQLRIDRAPIVEGAHLLARGAGGRIQPHRLEWPLRPAAFGQGEQLGERDGEPARLGNDDFGGLTRLLEVGPVDGAKDDPGVTLQRGDGRAQLVRCVGDEVLLLGGRLLGTGEQPIERAGEAAELVGASLGDPPVQLGAGDVVDLAPHPLDRAQSARREDDAQKRRRDDDHGADGEERPQECRERRLDRPVPDEHDRDASSRPPPARGCRARRRVLDLPARQPPPCRRCRPGKLEAMTVPWASVSQMRSPGPASRSSSPLRGCSLAAARATWRA